MSKKKLSTSVKVQMVFWALFMPVCLILAIWFFLPDANKDDDIQFEVPASTKVIENNN